MINDLVTKVYQATIGNIIAGIDKEYVEEIRKNYYEELSNSYRNVEVVDGMFEEAVTKEIEFNNTFYGKMDPSMRMYYFLKDPAFDTILYYYHKTHDLYDENEKLDYDKIIEDITNKLNSVRDFNRASAEVLSKETISNLLILKNNRR